MYLWVWDPGLHHLQVRNTSLATAASDCTAAWRRRSKAYESSLRTCQHRRPPIRRWLAVVKSRGLELRLGAWAGGRTLASSSTVGEAISHRSWHPDCTLLLMQHALLAPSIGALFGAYVATEAWTHRWGFKAHYLYLYGYFELAQSPLGRAVRHTTLFRPRRRQ